MITLALAILLSINPINSAESDFNKLNENGEVRYIYLPKENKEDYVAAVSFTLNSISTKRRITRPKAINETVLRFNLDDYGISAKAYSTLGVDNNFKGKSFKKLQELMKCNNPIVRADWFIIKAMSPPYYYNMLDVKKVEDFYKRHGYIKTKNEQAAIVVASNVTVKHQLITRSNTLTGVMWELKEKNDEDFSTLLSEQYDSVQILATNPNGLISWYAHEKKKPLDFINPDVMMDYQKNFKDMRIMVARNCISCHSLGIQPFKNFIKNLKKMDIVMKVHDKKMVERINDLFANNLDKAVKRDQRDYAEALHLTTNMTPEEFNKVFVKIHKAYEKDLTLKQVATQMQCSIDELKRTCETSNNPHLLMLVKCDRMSRRVFEQYLGN